jgi:peptidoglycan/LPS O-acetylase OafA/YrhL
LKYIKGFDTIRAFAVLIVIIGHWGPSFKPGSAADVILNSFVQDGRFGVILFFVLSGYLITSILLNEKIKNTEGKHFTIIKNFFARRALRIFPIYYLVVLLYFFLNDPFVTSHIWYFLSYTSNLPPYWTDTPNILSHTWSLSVEEQFYLIWPWLIILVNKKYIKHILAASIFIGIISKYYVIYVLHHKYPVLVFNCFDSFGIGGMYAYIRLNKEKARKFERGFVAVFPVLLFIGWKISHVDGLPIFVMYSRTLDSIIGIAMIMFVLKNQNEWIRKYILENRVFNFIGKISYGIYLYHFTFSSFFDGLMNSLAARVPALASIVLNPAIEYCLKLGSLFFVCWLSFRFIEQPIIRLKKKFEYT